MKDRQRAYGVIQRSILDTDYPTFYQYVERYVKFSSCDITRNFGLGERLKPIRLIFLSIPFPFPFLAFLSFRRCLSIF